MHLVRMSINTTISKISRLFDASVKSASRALLRGCSRISANSSRPSNCCAIQSSLRTLESGSREPKARAAATKMDVLEGMGSDCDDTISFSLRVFERRLFSRGLGDELQVL